MNAGVYTILNLVTGRCYVGSSANVSKRWYEHLSQLRRNIHHNHALQTDWDRYGSKAFSWSLIQECSRAEIIQLEQSLIDSTPDLYNAARRAGSGPRDGFRHTEESKRKMAAKAGHRKGATLSVVHKEALRRSNLGRCKSAEEIAKLRASLKKRPITWGAKISEAKKGVAMTPSAKESYDLSRERRGLAVSQSKSGVHWSEARRAAWLASRITQSSE